MDAKKWTRRLASRPLVALDWNFIRSMRDTASALPNTFNYLVPEMALVEAVTSDSASPVKLTKNLLRFLKLNQCRTFLASHIGHFIPAEDSPGKLAPPGFIAHAPFFETEAEAFDVDVATLENRVREMKGHDHPYASIQREFEEGRSHFADLMRQGAAPHGKLEHNHPDDFDRLVVEPKIAAGWATRFDDKYEDPEWQAALGTFPDQHAAGR